MEEYILALQGTVVLPEQMNCSLVEFAHRIRVAIETEQLKPLPDNALIGLLCDAARAGWELGATLNKVTNR